MSSEEKTIDVMFIDDEDVACILILCKEDKRLKISNRRRLSDYQRYETSNHVRSRRKSGYGLRETPDVMSKCREYFGDTKFKHRKLTEDENACESKILNGDAVSLGISTTNGTLCSATRERTPVSHTPHTVRKKRKETLERILEEIDSDEDFSDSESEFNSSDVTSSNASNSDCSDSGTENTMTTPKSCRSSRKNLNTSIRRRRLDFNECDYTFDADAFFQTKKGHTSNVTLKKFQNFIMKREELNNLLITKYVRHEEELRQLYSNYELDFDKWMFYLREGFSLLMYGLGSKIDLMDRFVFTALNGCYVLKVQGFSPKFSVRELLRSILMKIFEENSCSSNVNDAFDRITILLKQNNFPVFIVIHNLDSCSLRLPKNQLLLSRLAALPGIHFIATIDHVNAPLLWGNKMMKKFNFVCLHVSTYQPYIEEMLMKDGSKIQTSLDSGLSSLSIVYNGCVEKTKKLFRIILKDQLDAKSQKYKGIHLNKLLSRASAEIFIDDKRSILNMLKNFFEHEIIKIVDDCLIINIKRNLLNSFHDEQTTS